MTISNGLSILEDLKNINQKTDVNLSEWFNCQHKQLALLFFLS